MASNNKLEWTNAKRKLSELIPWSRNPRKIGAEQTKRLNTSLLEFAQVETIAIGPDNEVYNGHQRLTAWAAEYGDLTVDVRVASRALTEKEREKLTVFLHKGAAGEWDFEKLAEFDVADLTEWGFDASDFPTFDIGEAIEEKSEENYSRKIQSPDYEPSNNKPAIQQLFDDTKTQALIKEIKEEHNISEDERSFLMVAAQRHTILDFSKIADFYAHSDKAMQKLMEDSALVIIDFDRAIELGFVKIAEEIAEQYGQEYGDD